MSDQDVYLRQGGSTIEAASTDMRIKKDIGFIVLVTREENSYLAALRVTDDGTVKCTRLDDDTPGA
jgi:hypothetical protein